MSPKKGDPGRGRSKEARELWTAQQRELLEVLMSQVPVTLDDVRAIVGPPPEPEEGVVDRVVDSDDWAWQRGHDGWHRVREEDGSWVDVAYTWEQMDATYGPVRALR